MAENLDELPARDRAALAAFAALQREGGLPPTIVAVGGRMGLPHPNHAKRYLDALVASGHLERAGVGSRAYRLPDGAAADGDSLPLCGRVAAGQPLTPAAQALERIQFRAEFGGDEAEMVEVVGDSMIDLGFEPGDVISFVRRPPRDGDVVVCYFPEEGVTVKLFRDLGRRGLFLEPASKGNPAHKPRKLVAADDPQIAGVYVATMRTQNRRLRAVLRRRGGKA